MLTYCLSWMCVSQACIHSHTQTVHRQRCLTVCHGCVYHKHTYIHTHRHSLQAMLTYSLSWMCVSQAYIHSHAQTQAVHRQHCLTVHHGCVYHKHTCIHTHRHSSQAMQTYRLSWMDVSQAHIHSHRQAQTPTIHCQY